jgi:hypothetical protein
MISALTACGGGGDGGTGISGGLPASMASATPSTDGGSTATATAKPGAATWKPLKPGTSWQWQIDGNKINETILDGVDNAQKMYDVDMENTDADTIARLKAKGIYVVCYMETGGWEQYREDAAQFPESVKGNPVEGFSKERWLDIRQLDILLPLMKARFDRARAKGCDGIEPDLDDAYTRKQSETGFPLTKAHQLAYNAALIGAAHDRDMSMGLKNGPDFAEEMADIADWALNEECNYFEECDGYLKFIAQGKAVFNVEYSVPNGSTLGSFCPYDNRSNFDGLLKKSSETLGALPRAACRFE